VLKNQSFAFPGFPFVRALIALAMLWLGGCLQTATEIGSKDQDPPDAYDAVRRADLQPRFPRAVANADTGGSSPGPASYFGTPVEAVVKAPPASSDGSEGFALNFENTPVATVAKVVLGDILNVGYVIDPRAQGTISLSSGRPIAKSDMLFVLENALRVNNLVLVQDTVGYRILPATDGTVGGIDRVGANDATIEPGYGMTVIPVQYVSGATLVKLMEGFASKPGAIRTDPSGKLLLVLGTGSERQTAVDTVRSFDVDWLRGQSVGIYPVSNSAPATVVAELEKIMDSGESGLGHNLVKFQAIERQNSILVVASKPELLRTASVWISRLDKSAVASTGVKVYRVKYGDARQMAALLSNMFTGGGGAGLESPSNEIAPGSGTTSLSTVDKLTGGAKQDTSTGNAASAGEGQGAQAAAASISTAGTLGPLGGGGGGGGNAPLPGVRITADVANNAVLVYANEDEYRIIERALSQLDRPKLQVAIDVTIAEVTLNHDLSYGVQFFLTNNNHGSVSFTTGTTLPIITPNLPGFNFIAGGLGTNPHVILNALSQYTDVKILSNPSLVVVDNQPATLEVGQQVPISTGSATVLSANNAVVNTIDYKNVGIILHIQPRVSSNGTVLLDIEQEISAVLNNNVSGASSASAQTNLTPTITVRRVKSELSVVNGQTVLLAGLIQETQNIVHSGLPILDQLPVVGKAFGANDNSIDRDELILFIRPQIIQNGADASVVAEELRSKMRGGNLGQLGLPNNLFVPQPTRTLQ
jgi:general secretion pathway protein D